MALAKGLLQKFYQRRAQDVYFFGWVRALTMNMPAVTIKDAIRNYMEAHSLTDKDFNCESAMVSYERMTKELMDAA